MKQHALFLRLMVGALCANASCAPVDPVDDGGVPVPAVQHPLLVSLSGTGRRMGTVSIAGHGTACTESCTLMVAEGSTLRLEPTTVGAAAFEGWSGDCRGSGPCELAVNGPTSVTAEFSAPMNVVFVTSSSHLASHIQGLAGADVICNRKAMEAQLAGRFVAFLSDSTTDAMSRLEGASGWVRTDGLPFTDEPADLARGVVYYPPSRSERGDDFAPGSDLPVTGSMPDGTRSQIEGETFCSDWTRGGGSTRGGAPWGGTDTWVSAISRGCSGLHHLYCFQVDHRAALSPPNGVGKVAFVSVSIFHPDQGADAADALCAAEAAGAGLAGSFKALLATTLRSAASRFDPHAQYVRADGVILGSLDQWLAALQWNAALNTSADGNAYVGYEAVWTGTLALDLPGTPETTCMDWSSRESSHSGHYGEATDSRKHQFDSLTLPCNLLRAHVYCLEQ